MQVGQVVIDILQFLTPIGIFVYLIKEQVTPATLSKVCGQLVDAVGVEPDVIHTGVEYGVVHLVVLLDMLEQQSSLAHTSGTTQTDKRGIPCYLVFNITHKVDVSSIVFCYKSVI